MNYRIILQILGWVLNLQGIFMLPPCLVGLIYKALENDKAGRASAAALILFAIIFVVTMINLRVSKKRTHY